MSAFTAACACMGPREGEPACPCRMNLFRMHRQNFTPHLYFDQATFDMVFKDNKAFEDVFKEIEIETE